jgi:transposase InsO family protein
LKLLDALAMVKVNVFHWHLVDDQAWRLAIAKYPQLVRPVVGAWNTSSQETGYYSATDIREIVDRAIGGFHIKTTGPDQLWHTDASYFFVAGWGYYYLISVLDDYSRMVLASRVQPNMASTSIIEVIQDAGEFQAGEYAAWRQQRGGLPPHLGKRKTIGSAERMGLSARESGQRLS